MNESAAINDLPMKRCNKCGITKPATKKYWYGDITKKDGFYTICKECKLKSVNKYEEQKRYIAQTFGDIVKRTINTSAASIDIELLFDTHYGYKYIDYKLLERQIKYLAKDNVYAIWGGDVIEVVPTTARKWQMLKDQIIPTDEQWEWLWGIMKSNPEKGLCFLLGNHEGRYIRNSDPMLSKMSYEYMHLNLKRYGVPFRSENNCALELNLNGIQYNFVLSHGFGGARTPEYVIKRMFYDGLIPDDTNFVVIGHSHHNVPEIPRDRVIKKDDQMLIKRWIGIRPGSTMLKADYLKYYGDTIPGNVILQLSTKRHEYRLFNNIDYLERSVL